MFGRKPKLLVLSFCVILLLICQIPMASGISPGITVTPAQISLTLDNQDTEKSVPLVITNSYSVPISLVAVFQGIDENAGLLIPTTDLDKNFETNLHISQTDINIAANSSVTVTLQVSNAASLSPGGHYATLVLTQQSADTNQSAYRASLSLSIFVVKSNGAIRKLKLLNMTDNGGLFKLPSVVVLNFSNVGNVHVVPRGLAEITSGEGIIAKGIVNENSIPLLPDKTLTSIVNLQPQKSTWLPQKVTLTVTYRADGAMATQELSLSSLYIPPLYILGTVLVILFAYILTKQFKSFRKNKRKPNKRNFTSVRPGLHWDNPLKDELSPSVKIQVKEGGEAQSKEAERITLTPKIKRRSKPTRTHAKKASTRPAAKSKKNTKLKTTNKPVSRKSSKNSRTAKSN